MRPNIMIDRLKESRSNSRGDRLTLYVLTHGRFFLTGALLVLVLCAISATGLRWNENIIDLLPKDDPVVSGYCRFLERFDITNYLYFEIGSTDSEHELGEDELIAHGDALHEQLASSGHFEKIVYRWEAMDFVRALRQITRHRASLFTERDAGVLADKLSYDAINDALEEWKGILTGSPAPFLSESFYEDPLHINEPFIGKLHALQSQGAPLAVHEGRLFSGDLKHVLIIALPRFPSTDSYHAEELIAFLDGAIENVRKGDPTGRTRIAYFGGHRASLDNAGQIKGDIKLTIALSVAAIALLSFLIYRRLWLVLLTFIPVFFGATFATGVVRWVDPFISAISIGCGSMLIGISVDYAIHVLYCADQIADGADLRRETVGIVRRLFPPIVLSASTTIVAFCVLHFSIMPGYRNLGHFGALGILGAAVFSTVALPIIVTRLLTRTGRNPWWRLTGVFVPLFEFASRRKAPYYALIALLCLFSLVGLWRLRVEGDIRQLNSVSAQTRRDWDRVVSVFGDVMSSTAFAVEGADLEQALEKNEVLAAMLGEAQQRGEIRTINTVAGLMPSQRTQKDNRKRWERFWAKERLDRLREDVRRACSHVRMRPEAFEEFFQTLPGPMPAISYEDYGQGPLSGLLASQMSRTQDDVILLTRVKLKEQKGFAKLADDVRTRVPGAIAFNGRSFVGHMVELIYAEMRRLGAMTLSVIAVILLVFVRRPVLLVALFLPLLASLLWTFGLMGWLDIRLNLMNSVVAVFIFGLIVDYSIFMTLAMRASRGAYGKHVQQTCGAITISALTTLCGMGALLFARHPALHTIGATAFLGICTGLLAVFTIIPLLGKMIGETPGPPTSDG